MIKALITRKDFSDEGTFGTFEAENFRVFTGELPWMFNANNVSCISPGRYTCKRTYSPSFRKMMYLVVNVDRRDGIRFHAANYMGSTLKGFKSQLYGCIALGEKLGVLGEQRALLVSAPAIRRFEDLMQGQDFHLEIVHGNP